jgi:hypothetical protein
VGFSQEIKDNFSDYQVVVSNSRGGTLVFAGSTLDEAGYFKVEENETLTWQLTLVNNKGVTYTTSDTYEGVLPKEHYNLNFSLGEAEPDQGGMFLTIKLDNTTEVKEFSANVDFGGNEGPSITVNEEFQKIIDSGAVPFGVLESKVVTMVASKGIKSAVIRHSDAALYAAGLPYYSDFVGISQSQLSSLEAIGIRVQVASAVLSALKEGETVLSPGMKYRHYAPKAPLFLLNGDEEKRHEFLAKQEGRIAYLCYEEEMEALKKEGLTLYSLGSFSDPKAQASRLFSVLREADKENYDSIYAPVPSQSGMGLALYNRMIRAAAHQIIPL